MPAPKKQRFDERLKRLQTIVATLEDDTLELEESVRLYKEGLELSQLCRQQLDAVHNELQLLNAEGLPEPLDERSLIEPQPDEDLS